MIFLLSVSWMIHQHLFAANTSLPPTKAKQRKTPRQKEMWGVVPKKKLTPINRPMELVDDLCTALSIYDTPVNGIYPKKPGESAKDKKNG
jgi:hypothetical protein